MRLFIVILYLLSFGVCSAQLHYSATQGAYSNAIGGASAHLNNIDAIFSNQAGIADIDSISFIASSELRFSVTELGAAGIGVVIPTNSFGSFGINIQNFGFAEYKEQKLGIAYARKLFPNFNLGAQIDLLNTSIEGFGNKVLATFELGVQAKLGENFRLGAHIFSPGNIELLESDNNVNSRIRIAASYFPSQKVTIALEVDKWLQNEVSIKAGIDYKVINNLHVRLGANTNPASFGIGVAYNIGKSFSIEGTYVANNQLGYTPSFSVKSER